MRGSARAAPRFPKQARHVCVFQRTPNFCVPAHNGPIDPSVLQDWRVNRERYREQARNTSFAIVMPDESEQSALDATPEERRRNYEARWARGGFALVGAYGDLTNDKAANDTAVEFVAEKIRGIVKDPHVAEKLVPKTYPLATKRLCVDTGYYDTFNRDTVTLVDLREEPIEAITATGERTASRAYEFDVIVYAIGFDAMTGALNNIDIRGRDGVALKHEWSHGPRTYLGLAIAGFPNLFIVIGLGSPSVLANMAVTIEQHVNWIAACIAYVGDRQIGTIEATPAAQADWVQHVNEVADDTLFPLANSWYMGANIPGKPRVFMPYIGGFNVYREKCDEIAANGYPGFTLTSSARDA